MLSFRQFLAGAADRGEAVNVVFEERLFHLVGLLHKISTALNAERIPHQLIGGLAVLIHVEEVHPELSSLTRDVDLLVQRSDLESIKTASEKHGFRYRHAAGVDMLLFGEGTSTANAIHLLFSAEKVRPSYSLAAPPIQPVRKFILGQEVLVIPVVDLVRMKLTSFRLKDQVHVKTLDAAGLIGNGVETGLTEELATRLRQVRETE